MTRYGERTFVSLSLAGHPQEYVLASNFTSLLDALPCTGPHEGIGTATGR